MNDNLTIIKGNDVFNLFPISTIYDFYESGQDPKILLRKDIAVINTIVFLMIKVGDTKYFINEKINLIEKEIKETFGRVGELLIEFYETFPPNEISKLFEDGIFVVIAKKLTSSSSASIAAISYIDDYFVTYEGVTYKFPSVMIHIPIAYVGDEFTWKNPEIISIKQYEERLSRVREFTEYRHPFVYRDFNAIGHKVCLGSFMDGNGRYNKNSNEFKQMSFIEQIRALMIQTKQILINGYMPNVLPAGPHLNEQTYADYIVRREG